MGASIMNTKLLGLHHITAITSSSPKMFRFMTEILGLHLIKKTVNQDDVRTYHLYFTDDMGSAGTDITFFDFPGLFQGTKGKNGISRIGFRVPSDDALDFWAERFHDNDIEHDEIQTNFGSRTMNFYDFDHEQYQLISDERNHGVEAGTPYLYSPIPKMFAISGLGTTIITVDYPERMDIVLTELMGFDKIATEDQRTLYELNEGGHGAQVIIEESRVLPNEIQAYGTVHHIAFRTEDEESLAYWIERIQSAGLSDSGFVDRFYFKSEYFRPGEGVLFEIATDGPGFLQDETYEEAGIHLELPPFLEDQRADIEAHLVNFNSDKKM
ncbi:glyoxalase family protein [Dellaglioa algida DSM 15638]|uniref:Glyoxalase family protein n=2 Tax=Dellaglioa algida TaxID=105612 RepID=A0A0R1HT46_9LACO|nr:glyoxalase family protein [Dellaglioa algida DSM 15638]